MDTCTNLLITMRQADPWPMLHSGGTESARKLQIFHKDLHSIGADRHVDKRDLQLRFEQTSLYKRG